MDMEKPGKGTASATPTESLQTPTEGLQIAVILTAIRDLYQAKEDLRSQDSIQRLGMEFSLISTWESAVFVSYWRERRPPELNESGEWRYLTAYPVQGVETLQERFDQMRIEGMGQVCRFKQPGIMSQPTLMFPPHCGLAPAAAKQLASPPLPQSVQLSPALQ